MEQQATTDCGAAAVMRVPTLQVMSAAFAPDGSKAVTASKDGTLRIWNLAVRYQLQVWLSNTVTWDVCSASTRTIGGRCCKLRCLRCSGRTCALTLLLLVPGLFAAKPN
jgi:WD40 repeat protein